MIRIVSAISAIAVALVAVRRAVNARKGTHAEAPAPTA